MRSVRRLVLFVLVAVAGVVGPAYGMLPAEALGSHVSASHAPVQCRVTVPARVSAVSASTAVTPTFTGCAGKTEAWEISHTVGDVHAVLGTFSVTHGVSAGAWQFRDSYPTGTYEVTSRSGRGNQTSLTVKFGSRISLRAGTRSGAKVPLSGFVSRYSPTAHAFQRWTNRPVAISYKTCSTCAWKFLATIRTNARGHFAMTATSTRVRYYHARVQATSSVWGRTSAPVRL